MAPTLQVIPCSFNTELHFSTKWTRNSENGPTTGPGITDRMTNLRYPLANRTTCTQGLPPTLGDQDPVKGAMETDFFPRATIILGPRCKQGDSVKWDPVGKNHDFPVPKVHVFSHMCSSLPLVDLALYFKHCSSNFAGHRHKMSWVLIRYQSYLIFKASYKNRDNVAQKRLCIRVLESVKHEW